MLVVWETKRRPALNKIKYLQNTRLLTLQVLHVIQYLVENANVTVTWLYDIYHHAWMCNTMIVLHFNGEVQNPYGN